MAPGFVTANPAGGTVVAGQAAVSSSGPHLTVNQSTDRAIINWQSFSVGTGETARFNLPSSSAAVLNRVTGSQLSSLMGTLASNGHVYLLNPNGIVVGPNGHVVTGGFVASTLNLSDDQFLKGGAQTFRGSSTAGVVILGTVKASSGDVLLVASQVDNRGKLIAPDGHVVLAAGSEVLYAPDGETSIVIGAPAPATGAAVNNSGIIEAASVQLAAAGSPYALAVNNGGEISATAVKSVGGRVVLEGGAGNVAVDGSISAVDGADGGTVSVAGARVAVTADGKIAANAASLGRGGAILVKGTVATDFAGTASATGGARGGDGGQAEISGGTLGFSGKVDLTAAKGRTGSLLLDPDEITVVSGNDQPPSNAGSGTWAYADDPGSRTISTGAIASLLASSNLTLQATNSITINGAISSPAANLLEFDSPTVAVNAAIALPNGFLAFSGITTQSGGGGQGGSPSTLLGRSLTTASSAGINAANIGVQGYNQIGLGGPVQTPVLQINQLGLAADSVTATHSGNSIGKLILGPDSSGKLDSYSGAINVTGTGDLTVEGAAAATGGITITSTGNLATLAADVTQGTQLSSTGAQITLGSSGGAFMNNVGTGLFAGTGRRVIYSSTNAGGYTDGGLVAGLGYSSFNPVAFGQDPNAGVTNVIYLASAPALPMLTITANDAVRTYGQPDPTFTASYVGGTPNDLTSPVQFSIQGGSDIYPGTYTIIPFGAISSSHQLDYIHGTLTVSKAPLLITANDFSRLYGGVNPGFTAGISGLVNGDPAAVVSGLTFATAATSASGVGSYAIVPSGASAANYAISYANGTLTVQPAPLVITPNLTRVYGGTLASSLPDSDYSGFVNGDTPASLAAQPILSTTATAASPVGSYQVSASGAAAGNYVISYAPGTLAVTPAPLLVTANDAARLYGAPNPAFSTTLSGLVSSDSASVLSGVSFTTNATTASGVGSYTIVPSGGSATNYSLSYASGSLAVTPAPLIITPNASRPYGGALPSALLASSFSGFMNGDTAASLATLPVLSSPATASSPVGSYGLTASGAAAANYNIRYAPGTLSVTPAPLLIAANDATRLYGAANPTFTETVSGLVNGETASVISGLSLATVATSRSNAGAYAIVASGASAPNYSIQYANGTLSVTPAPLILQPSASMFYGSSPTDAAITYSAIGFVNGDSLASLTRQPSFTTSATRTSNVGSYSIDASGGASPNYTIRYLQGEMRVNRAVLTLTPLPLTVVYGSGGPAPGSAGFTTTGLVNGDTLESVFATPPTVSVPSFWHAGVYPTLVLVGSQTSSNYMVQPGSGRLTVLPAPLTITPDLTLNQGAPLPDTLPASDFTGFVNGDTPASLTRQPTLTYADPLGSRVAASGAVNADYTITYQPGQVTRIVSVGVLDAPTVTHLTSGPQTSVTLNPNYTASVIYGPVLGGMGAEAKNVIDAFVASVSSPPLTAEQVTAMLKDPTTSATMLGTLIPYLYADLGSILDLPQSSWTPSQAFFVQQMQTYIQQQRQAAALQAEAQYETWANAQVAHRNQLINSVTGPAQVEMMAVLSGDPPVPPPDFLQAVQLGMSLNDSQAGSFATVIGQTASVGKALNGSTDAVNLAPEAGRAAGQLAVTGVYVYKVSTAANGWSGAGNFTAQKLGDLGKKIFPYAERSAAKLANAIAKNAEIDAAGAGQVSARLLGSQANKIVTAGTELIGAAGAVLEVVSNIVQIGMAADAYAKAADYNRAFRAAVTAANGPVSVADLKSMVNDHPEQMLNYLGAYAATGPAGPGQSFNTLQPNTTLDAILNITASNH
jgi:filamentous hemagglutinin family protein